MVEWWLTESHAVLVEESPSVFQLLTKSVHEEFDPTLKRIMPLNALICEEGQHKVFYGDDVDKLKAANVTRNLSLPHWVEYQISSLERKSTLQGLNRYFREARRHFPETVASEVFLKEDLLDCVSFETILAKSNMRAERVNVLAVDVEGFDPHVLLQSF